MSDDMSLIIRKHIECGNNDIAKNVLLAHSM